MWDYLKHLLHVVVLCLFIVYLQIESYKKHAESDDPSRIYTTYERYWTVISIIIQSTVLLSVPQVFSNFLGLTLFNTFQDKVEIKTQAGESSPFNSVKLPHLCFRIVTRGLFPELVQRNLNRNFKTCIEAGLSNFSIEIVTDNQVCILIEDERVQQIVVPSSYQTSSGARFKARALQYALEDNVSTVKEGDYIVHLDEETILTQNSINGIINFALDGKHHFGQGLITYANEQVVNWLTTLVDSYRVADDMGKLRFQFLAFHKPLFGWKGSYVVTRYEAEKDVSFDHGPDGSVAEDCYFSMIAYMKGYTFDFIQGEMLEKSPFSMMDLIRQRKRWLQGIWLTVHSSKIPLRVKIILAMSHYAWLVLPITTLSFITAFVFPTPNSLIISSVGSFCFAVAFYMYIFGILKSFDLKRTGRTMLFVYLIMQVFMLFISIVIENVAVIWGLIGSKHNFYIVQKDVHSSTSFAG